jgi:amylosucrase
MTFSNTEILKRIEKNVLNSYSNRSNYNLFHIRLEKSFPSLFNLLSRIYGNRSDFLYHLEEIIELSCKLTLERLPLKGETSSHLTESLRKGSQNDVGAVFYVDLYAGTLRNVKKKIPELKKMGITFIHLMPLFKSPYGETDGGYAVSSYREVDSRFGTMEDLKELARLLDINGISLVLDFILNHTSNQHFWAGKAKEGDPEFQDFYYIFDSIEQINEYSPYLRDIFPEVRKGSFTFDEDMKKWVWTTFNSYQWDLNYSNPSVFLQMLKEMFFLIEAGVEVLRFDAPAFIWKIKGTSCENLDEVHILIQAFKSFMNIVAPDVLFLSEAIVHPDEIAKYISVGECELSYNPLLMATLWESLATRKTDLLKKSMENYISLPEGCFWINYIRCHDDIGWTFSDHDAWEAGLDPRGHRKFLNDFYTGRFPGSFAKGLPFQENMQTGDLRISGTLASLAGLEKAVLEETEYEVSLAVKRVLLLYGIILSMSGYPLIYMGDELGMLNNYQYSDNPEYTNDSRWVHRQSSNFISRNEGHYSRSIYKNLISLIKIRKNCRFFEGNSIQINDIQNSHTFSFNRINSTGQALTVIANFTEQSQNVRLEKISHDIISKKDFNEQINLEPYQILWLKEIGCE